MTRSHVLGAKARFPTEYDSKGDGLMRLAGGHRAPLLEQCAHKALCDVLIMRQKWEATFRGSRLVTHHLSHTSSFTQLRYTQLFTHKRFNSSIIHHLLCLSFHPRPTGKSWKKLTCGVIRSFNLSSQFRKQRLALWAAGSGLVPSFRARVFGLGGTRIT